MEGGWRRGVQGRLEEVLAASSGIPKVPKYCRFFSPEEMAERFLEILKKMSEKRS